MAKAANETDPEVLAAFDLMIAGIKDIERKGAAMPYVSINGNMYGMVSKANAIGIRLSPADLTAFLAAGATPFEGTPGFITKEYATVPPTLYSDKAALQGWFKKSHAFASALKPKKTTR